MGISFSWPVPCVQLVETQCVERRAKTGRERLGMAICLWFKQDY